MDNSYSEDSEEDDVLPTEQTQPVVPAEKEDQGTSTAASKEFIFNLLERTRKIISTVHRSTNLNQYVRDQIDAKQQAANKRAQEDKTEPLSYNDLIMDFRIRWSTTFIMLTRFILLSPIINNITFTPQNIYGVEPQHVLKLLKLGFNQDEWNLLSGLQHVLDRFTESTRLVSDRTYQALAVGKMILDGLKHFLTRHKSDQPWINQLKKLVLPKFEQYCQKNLCPEAEEAIIIASFLNPTSYFVLHEDEQFIKKAKQLIVLKSRSEKFAPKRSCSSNETPVSQTLSNIMKKSLSTIEAFLARCDAPVPSRLSTASTTKCYSVQQEIGYYISSVAKETDFQEFWNKNQEHLPILTRLVRHYCIMPFTSVASESAFSNGGIYTKKTKVLIGIKHLTIFYVITRFRTTLY